jgi:hypothetical protein
MKCRENIFFVIRIQDISSKPKRSSIIKLNLLYRNKRRFEERQIVNRRRVISYD